MKLRDLALLLFVTACGENATRALPATAHTAKQPSEGALRVAAATAFTERYAHSRFSEWKIRANAAGPRCDVLVLRVALVLEDSMVEAMQYGAGPYDVTEGGVQRFSLERGFRGVAYKDASSRLWTFGAVTVPEAERSVTCQ